MEILKLFLLLSTFFSPHSLHFHCTYIHFLLLLNFGFQFSCPCLFQSALLSPALVASDSLLLVLSFSPSGHRVSNQMKVSLWASMFYSGPKPKKLSIMTMSEKWLPAARGPHLSISLFNVIVWLCFTLHAHTFIIDGVYLASISFETGKARLFLLTCFCCFLCLCCSLHLYLEWFDIFSRSQMAFTQITLE